MGRMGLRRRAKAFVGVDVSHQPIHSLLVVKKEAPPPPLSLSGIPQPLGALCTARAASVTDGTTIPVKV